MTDRSEGRNVIERKSWLPFDAVNVRPGEIVQVVARPQRPFRGQRLAVWSVTASSFVIERLQVGWDSMAVSSGACPAEIFATKMEQLARLDVYLTDNNVLCIEVNELATDVIGQEVYMPVAQPGMDVLIQTRNVDDVPRSFHAVVLGVWVEIGPTLPLIRKPRMRPI